MNPWFDRRPPGAIRGFFLLELLLVVLLILLLNGLALVAYRDHFRQSRLVETVSLFSGLRIDAEVYRAFHGAWPDAGPSDHCRTPVGAGDRARVDAVCEQGAITLMGHYQLTFRPATPTGHPMGPVHWICGPADPGAGWALAGRDRTKIDPARPPAGCRP